MRILLTCFFVGTLHVALAQSFYEIIATFQADESALKRKYTLTLTVEYFERMTEFYNQQQLELKKIEFSSLTLADQVDYLLFKNLLEKNTYFLNLDKKEFQQVSHVTDFGTELYDFVRNRRVGQKPDAQKLALYFEKASTAIDIKKNKIESEGNRFGSWQQAELAAEVVIDLHKNLKESIEFYDGYDIEFGWWLAKPVEKLNATLESYAAFLRGFYSNTSVKDDGSGIIGKPIGREAIIKSLQFEFIPYTPEELIKLAENEFVWCEKEMLKASNELGFGNDWKAALEKVKNTYVPPGQWPEDIKNLAEEAIDFVESRALITVPELAKETWRMIMMSPERQLVSPFFLGGETIMISYPTHTMDHDAKMMSLRGNNPYFSRAVVHHELIPGHHLQQFMNQRYKPYRRPFNTPFWTEGWALYWEFNLWDKGFAKTPEEKIGMLFWRMHRCARIIFSLNYHMNKMTPQQCIDFLVERVGHERANAEAEVRRSFTGRYGPLYQIAYMIGGLQFYQLKNEFVDNGNMNEKDFHDYILQQNNMPVELVRASLNQQKLTPDFKSNWKFYSSLK